MPVAGHAVPDFDRVAHGEDVGVARAQVFVDANAAVLAQQQSGLMQDIERTRAERIELERKVSLLRTDNLDPDMLDERARFQLDYANPRDLVRIVRPVAAN